MNTIAYLHDSFLWHSDTEWILPCVLQFNPAYPHLINKFHL